MAEKRCTATTAAGQPCRNKPREDSEFCKQHSGDDNIGRRTALTEQVGKKIVDLMSLGAFVEDAVRSAGIAPATYYGWIERGEADQERGEETVFSEFVDATTRARVAGKIAAVGHIRRGMQEDWRAAAWYLERTDPENWGRRDSVAHTGKIRTETVEIPDDQERMVTVAEVLAATGAVPAPDDISVLEELIEDE